MACNLQNQQSGDESSAPCKARDTSKTADSYASNSVARFHGGCIADQEHNSRTQKKYQQVIVKLPGYPPKRDQHFYYRTSSMDLGMRPTVGHLPVKYFPRDNSFTLSVQGIGNYMDSHFTTELDDPHPTQL